MFEQAVGDRCFRTVRVALCGVFMDVLGWVLRRDAPEPHMNHRVRGVKLWVGAGGIERKGCGGMGEVFAFFRKV